MIRTIVAGYRKLTEVVVMTPHELCHEAAARLLGLDAARFRSHVVVEPGPAWKMILVALTPAVVGLSGLAASVWGWRFHTPTPKVALLWSAAVWFWGWWIATCITDFSNVAHLIRFGAWPRMRDWEE